MVLHVCHDMEGHGLYGTVESVSFNVLYAVA